MAEDYQRNRLYEYNLNSNLVLVAERDNKRRADEPTGEVESLAGRQAELRMGVRISKEKPTELLEKLEKSKAKRARVEADDELVKRKRQSKNVFLSGVGSTVLSATDELEASAYKPTTRESRSAYEEILTFIKQAIGDQPRDILRGAAEEVLAILKQDDLRDPTKHTEIEKILSKMSAERFNRLVNLGKQIHDFSVGQSAEDDEDRENKLDEDMGVAVVFDEDEDEDGGDVDEVRESEDDDDDDEGGVETTAGQGLRGGVEEEEMDVHDPYKLDVHDIDAHWLQRGLSKYYDDANMSAKLAEDILKILAIPDERDCENKLVMLLNYDKFDFIKLLMRNKLKVLYCTRLKQAQTDDERRAIEEEMRADVDGGGAQILEQLYQQSTAESWVADRTAQVAHKARQEARALRGAGKSTANADADEDALPTLSRADHAGGPRPEKVLDLEALTFAQGGHLMTNRRVELPEQSWRAQKKGYEEVHVPAVKVDVQGEKLVRIDELEPWMQPAFKGYTTLNRIQSRLAHTALEKAENMLLCAPTGAGKTNVALLCMLGEIAKHRNEDGSLRLNEFKIVYVAPMKALVQECVTNFSQRLNPFGITVKELSGDQSLSRQQIQETQVIVTTPEKWDIITRKSGDRTYTQLVRLIIIDEIHLLHDERGPVLETIVARSIRQVETTQDMIRLVGLSATLPNYEDVATFLRVDPKEGLFYFDSAFRPIPLQQQYIGITEKKALKRFQLMNEICYEKVLQCAGKHQVLIFVHSRAETIKTAKALRDMAVENDVLNRFVQEDSGSKEILREESNSVVNPDLKDLLPYGFAIHHAGLVRDDRNLVEDLFADKHVQVLVSTATLAWGVNLPAHTVILKGTQMYNPEQGRWTELSPLDIMQMMGRAGRPGFDSEGEGIIITQHSELQYYLSLMNQQLPIESQLIKRLADLLNAEAVLGTINTVREAAEWLGYTYLYVRMRRNPGLYGITPEEFERDPTLLQRRLDLAYSACALLDRNNLIKYDRRSGVIQVTTLGRVASYYYISHESMAVYNEYLKPTMSDIEIFRLFSLSGEFKQIHVRDEEKLELQKLVVRVPIPIKEGIDEPSAKVNVLLQAYISRLKLEGFALVSDMTYIQQSATRIMRALFEIALKRGWAALAERILICCKLVEKRIWRSQSPMRQFGKIPEAIIRKLEKNSDLTWDRYYDLKPADLGEIVRMPKMGKTLHKYVHMFPRLELSANVQPITRSLLKVELTIMPDFQYDIDIHGFALLFWILVVDGDGERILHQEPFMLKGQYADQEHTVNFSVPIIDPLPPQYFIKVVADRWLHAVTVLPVSFKELILPHKYPPPTELLDLKPLPVHALKNREYEALYQHLREFNPIQTQTYSTLYQSNDNTLVCAPAGSGKTICGEFAILRMFNQNPDGKCVYLAPKSQIADRMYDHWVQVFVGGLGKTVVRLTGETSVDLKLLERGHIIISDVQQWDALSRRWKQRKHVQNVSLYISDELHLLGGVEGHTLEVILSRARYVASQLEKETRIVGLGASMANAKDIGDWLGVPPTALFNFAPDVRPVPLEVRLHGLDVNHFSSRMLAMAKPTYNAVANDLPAIVFVPSRSQAQLTAVDLSIYAQASEDPDRFLAVRPEEMEPVLETIKESALRDALKHGVGYLHMGLLRSDRERVEALWNDGVIKVLVAPYTMCWSIATAGHTVVVMGTEYYEGKEHRYVDYPVTDILQMLGLACRPQDSSGKCVVLCHAPKKDYLKKILHDPLPVESHLNHFLHDHMNAEVVTRTIENKQDAVDYMTWTFFYRRLTQNPNYYNLDMVNDIRISEYLSNLIESTLADLSNSGCLVVEDEFEVSPLNLGMIAAYYYIQYTTMEIFASSVKEKTKVKGICDIICAASEYANIPMRHQEEAMLERLARHLPQKLPASASFSDAATKAQVLLFSHFTRQALVSDLRTDLHSIVLADCVRLLQAIVDVISSNGWLKPALAAMEVSQMCVQGIWNSDSPLLQIPHFTPEVVERCATHDPVVESVFDILELEDDDRNELLQMTPEQLSDVARFCNNYPNIEVNYDLQTDGDVYTDDAVEMVVELQREVDESGVYGKVMSTRFPHDKTESWWLVVGDPSNNSLLAIKRVTIGQAAKVKLQFNAPEDAGDYNLVLYLMCDSYSGCDQEYEFNLAVLPGQKETDMDL